MKYVSSMGYYHFLAMHGSSLRSVVYYTHKFFLGASPYLLSSTTSSCVSTFHADVKNYTKLNLIGVVVTPKSLIAIHSDCELPYYRVALITNKLTSLRPFLSHPVRLLVNNSGLYIEYVDLLKGSVVAFRIPLTSLYTR